MREYGQIQCAFWQSRTCKGISDAARVLATYLLSGPHSNGIGCYSLPDGYVMGDLRWPVEKVTESFAELFRTCFAYRYDEVVFIPEFVKWNGFRNGNVAIARMDEFRVLTRGQSKAKVAADILKYGKHLTPEHLADLNSHLEYVPNDSEIIPVISAQQNPTQTLPNPDPTHTLRDCAQIAEPKGIVSPDDPVSRGTSDPDEFDGPWIDANWPPTANNRNYAAAIHSAHCLVGLKLATWAQLRQRVIGFAAHATTGGYSDPSKVPSMAKWFRYDDPERYWAREWAAVPSKADLAQQSTLDAARHLLEHGSAI